MTTNPTPIGEKAGPTPGPWGAYETSPGEWEIRATRAGSASDAEGGWIIATIDEGVFADDAEWTAETGANARLIAAAPAMYEALRAFVAAEDALLAELKAAGNLPDLTRAPWTLVDDMRAALSLALPPSGRGE